MGHDALVGALEQRLKVFENRATRAIRERDTAVLERDQACEVLLWIGQYIDLERFSDRQEFGEEPNPCPHREVIDGLLEYARQRQDATGHWPRYVGETE